MTLTQVCITDGKFSRVYEGDDTMIEWDEEVNNLKVKTTTITITEWPTPIYLRG